MGRMRSMVRLAIAPKSAIYDPPKAFLTNLILGTPWATSVLSVSAPQDNQDIWLRSPKDPNAQVVGDHRRRGPCHCFGRIRTLPISAVTLPALQKMKASIMAILRFRIMPRRGCVSWTMAEFHRSPPMEPLQSILDENGQVKNPARLSMGRRWGSDRLWAIPAKLKPTGMHPYLMGDFPVKRACRPPRNRRGKPYWCNKI